MGEKWNYYLNAKKTNEGKATKVNSAVMAGISVLGWEIPWSPWNYKISNFCYFKTYNWKGDVRKLSLDINQISF
jgi:hypothetical protein